jgi:hypothetical protein
VRACLAELPLNRLVIMCRIEINQIELLLARLQKKLIVLLNNAHIEVALEAIDI